MSLKDRMSKVPSKRFTHVSRDEFEGDLRDFETEEVEGARHYLIDGLRLPSVTTILGEMSDDSGLDAWRERVGDKEAQLVTKRATLQGSALHAIVEDYLNNVLTPDKYSTYPYNVQMLFRQLIPFLDHVDNIHLIESVLYSKSRGVAGRVDLVAEYDGVLSVIDWKTTKQHKPMEWLEDYISQVSIYAYMLFCQHNLMPLQTIICLAASEDPKPQIIKEKITIPNTHRALQKIVDYHKKMGSSNFYLAV